MDYYEIGDTLRGSKIYAEARKVDGPKVITKTGRHRSQSITLVENAKAVIIRKLKYVHRTDDEQSVDDSSDQER
ncbi:MAG: hypothetical protein HPY61_02950 [Methanotrichaceae archaeon]|nr:hypothetical protein [Methanotrichaceae archaeon]